MSNVAKKFKMTLGLVLYLVFINSACTINASIESTREEGSSSAADLPSSPTGLSLQDPSSSPSNMTHPTIRIAGVTSGDVVKLYSDSSCTSLAGTGTASSTTADIKIGALSAGTHNFYATRTNSGGTSSCSTATVQYILTAYGSATKLRFSAQPANTSIYEPMNTIVKVEILDANDKVVTDSAASVTLNIGTDPSGNTAVLMGTKTATAQFGVAYFTTLKLDEAGTGYTLVATSSGLTSATSNTFDVSSGPKYVFRSSGFLSSSFSASGQSLSISGNVATFSSSLSSSSYRIVLGDALTYDSNGAATNSVNQIVFVTAIISDTQFKVKTASGGTPVATTADLDWKIDRAYPNLVSAESGSENTTIDAALRNFDTWSGGRDIVTNNEVWNIYTAYGSDAALTIDGWTTGSTNYLNFYVPRYEGETAYNSYYHKGTYSGSTTYIWDTSYLNNMILIQDDYVRFDGFVVRDFVDGSDVAIQVTAGASSEVRILNSKIVSDTTASGTSNNALKVTSGNVVVANCLIGGYEGGFTSVTLVSLAGGAGANYYFYNNTIFGGYIGIDVVSGTLTAINNLVANVTDGFKGSIGASSQRNTSPYFGDTMGNYSASLIPHFLNVTSSYSSYMTGFNLSYRNTFAAYGGVNLWSNAVLPVREDIQLRARPPHFSLGAYQADSTLYRSVGFQSTAAVETGSSGSLSITSASTANFGQIFSNVKIGDIIEYYDGSEMQLAVIYLVDTARTRYNVLSINHDAAKATAAATTNWKIYRAHTSINKAFNRIENNSIDPTLVDFDSGQGSVSVPNNTRRIYYAAADQIHNENVSISGWTVTNHQLVLMSESTTSGIWSTDNFTILGEFSTDSQISIDSLQFEHSGTNSDPLLSLNDSNSNVYRSLFRATGKSNIGDAISIVNTPVGSEIFFNIIYDFKNSSGTAAGIRISGGIQNIAKNTIYNADIGIVNSGANAVRSNLLQACTDGLQDSSTATYVGNISDLSGDLIGTYDLNSTSVKFSDARNKNFQLDIGDLVAMEHLGYVYRYGEADAFGFPNDSRLAGAYQGPRRIFRSMGFNQTTALASGGGTNGLSISWTTGIATFASALPDNVGVGDVLVFKLSGSGVSDWRALIQKRISSTQYVLSDVSGLPINFTKSGTDTQWAIYRAYTSLSGLNSGSENTGIPAGLRNFDDHTAGRTIYYYREQWHVALYADATDTGAVTFGNWGCSSICSSSGKDYYIRFFTPSNSGEVGISQRHNGTPGSTGYLRSTGTARALDFYNKMHSGVILDGVQIQTSSASTSVIESPTAGSWIEVRDSIIYDQGVGYSGSGIAIVNANFAKLTNNLILGYTTGISTSNAVIVILTNNTVLANVCYNIADWIYATAINNVGYCGTTGFSVGPNATTTGSAYNATNDAIPIGTGSFQITQGTGSLFANYSNDDNYTNDDFSPKDANSQLYQTGTFITTDPSLDWDANYPFNWIHNILGVARGSGNWNVGAF